MKTPRVIARIVKPQDNAKQPDTPMVSALSLIGRQKDPKTKKFVLVECVTVRTYYSTRGNGMQPVRACVWIKSPRGTNEPWVSGRASAGGWGYHKPSAAIADAISSAGVELFGDPYRKDAALNKTPLHFGGTGDSAYCEIFEAIAKARGFRGPFLLVSH